MIASEMACGYALCPFPPVDGCQALTPISGGWQAEGEHCDTWVRQAEEIAQSGKDKSGFMPSKSATPLEIFVTVHLKAKNLKRLLAKVAMLADLCMQRNIIGSGNFDVYQDSKGHFKGDFEVPSLTQRAS